jgi:TPR repeat protein
MDAEDDIGDMYRDGSGVAKDYAQAMTWYEKATSQGNARAEQNIGSMYRDGLSGATTRPAFFARRAWP